MRNNFLFIITVSSLFFLSGACSKQPDTLATKYDEKEMKQAVKKAKATFETFRQRFKNPSPGDSDFAVKVRIEDENGVEHFWLNYVMLDREPYSGIIGNEAAIVKKVKINQKYIFSKSEISDWMYMSNGKMQGNYTLRVILKSMPPAKAKAIKEQVGW